VVAMLGCCGFGMLGDIIRAGFEKKGAVEAARKERDRLSAGSI
jgi:hypothetical protein